MSDFSSKYLNDFNILKNAFIGFEFEFFTNQNISYYKLLEKLNNSFRELNIQVQGFRKYHPETKPTETNYLITPDFSGGSSMVELITGKIKYNFARIVLLKSLQLIKEIGYTNEKCSIHINISFDDNKEGKTIDKVNRLKLILNVDEEHIYKFFPERRDNYYAKSVKRIIPFKQFNYASDALNILQSSLELPDNDRYYGINFMVLSDGRLEFRYIGHTDYEKKTNEILQLMDYFIILSWNCIDEVLTDDDIDELEDYLSKNINVYKNFNNLDNFIGNFPTINLEIDRMSSLSILNVHYNDLFDDLYDLISNTFNLNNCTINYDTDKKEFELVDATVTGIFDVNNWTIIDSTINGGVFNNCKFINCTINNTMINSSQMLATDAFKCKIKNSNVDNQCMISMSFFYGGIMNGEMPDGILRLAKVGETGIIGDDVKIVSDNDDFFGITSQNNYEEKEKNTKKGILLDTSKKGKTW
jgi:hypothetical protein